MIRALLRRPTPRTLTAESTLLCGARARSRSVNCCAHSRHSADTTTLRACPIDAPTGSATIPRAAAGRLGGPRRHPPPGARGRRDRPLARLHLRLQLLLDYRDAWTQLSHL